MLQTIRDNSQGLVAKIFVVIIILVFGLFGVEAIVGGFIRSSGSAASVNGVEIDEFELDNAAQAKTREMLERQGEGADPSSLDEGALREEALDELIRRELLLQAAEGAGMAISSAALDLRIAQTEDFQIDGVFDNERAQLMLQSYGHTPNTYREALTRANLLNQLLAAYADSGFATPWEMEQVARLEEQTRSFRYMSLDADAQMEGVEVSEEELETYYQDNQEEFRREEMVSIEYLELDKESLYADVEVTEEQLREQYDLEVADYQSQVERRASHILLEAETEEEFAEALAQAQDLKARLDEGDSFEELVSAHSDDIGSVDSGGDVGFTTGDSFVEEFEAALRELEVDEISEPVRTEFGVHIIKLTERSDTEMPSLEESRERIEWDLQTDEVESIFLAQAEELGNLAFESPDLDYPAEIMGLAKQTSELFGRSGGAGVTANDAVINAAFSDEVLLDGLNSDLVEVDFSRSIVLRALERQPSAIMDFAEVRGEIEVQLRFERASEQAQALGEALLADLRAGENVDALLDEHNLGWTPIDDMTRTDPQIDAEIASRIFALGRPASPEEALLEGFQLDSGEYVLVELQEVKDGALDEFPEDEQTRFKNFIGRQSGVEDYNAMLAGLESRAKIDR